jgi:hypothetical protein
MRGHENIISMRSSGFKPAGTVWLCDYPVRPVFIEWRYADDCKSPTVCTHGDDIAGLDLRFLVGLPVDIRGEKTNRVKALAGACRKAGAASVCATDGKHIAMWTQGEAKWQSF